VTLFWKDRPETPTSPAVETERDRVTATTRDGQ
jgi:hypothetical protein